MGLLGICECQWVEIESHFAGRQGWCLFDEALRGGNVQPIPDGLCGRVIIRFTSGN